MSTFVRAFFLLAATIAIGTAARSAEEAGAPSCQAQTFGEAGYVICSFEPEVARLELFWRNSDGQPYRTFAGVAEAVATEGKSLTFAMNAGMYSEDFSPIGLYVEGGREIRPVNTVEFRRSGIVPNFYKKPNGVFFLDQDGAGILPTDAFLKRPGKVMFATQSGPMLVIDGGLNPIFIPGSTDRTRRSGVGICEGGVVRFAISDGTVNFHDFATLFRDGLKCRDALFLDGGRGAGIYVPALKRHDWSGHGGYGPIVGLVE